MGNLGDRVNYAAERSVGGAAPHPRLSGDLTFLSESGRPAGMLAARLDANGGILSAVDPPTGPVPCARPPTR
ncbi:hypothetical protein [Streptomyces sp. NPDC051636]|uniref:hypothetical protein n=1 Tax=Streptomyces sp. NPDC051636 TaxID=3365663 RepID=UPI0037AE9AAA